MAYYHTIGYNRHNADNFVANNSDDIIYRGEYYKRPNNLEMLGRIMPEFANVLVSAYNHTPDRLAHIAVRSGYYCNQIANGDITAREAWQRAYISARCLHQLAYDIVADGFSYDASADHVTAINPSGEYGYSSYGFIAHVFDAMCDERWVDVLYEIHRKEYSGERRENIYQESRMRDTHTHYNRGRIVAIR